MSLTGIPDIERLVLLRLPYRDLLAACTSTTVVNVYCQDDWFWHDKVATDFGPVVNYKPEGMSYRRQYQDLNTIIELRVMNYAEAARDKRSDLLIAMAMLGLFGAAQYPEDIANEVARFGLLDALQWFAQYNVYPTESGVLEAAANGHLPVLQWMEQTRQMLPDVDGLDSAATTGHLPILQWAAQRGLFPSVYGANGAAYNNLVPVLDFLAQHNILPDGGGADLALHNGSREALDWMLQRGINPLGRSIQYYRDQGLIE